MEGHTENVVEHPVPEQRRSHRLHPTVQDRVEKALHLYNDDDAMSERKIAAACKLHPSLLHRSETNACIRVNHGALYSKMLFRTFPQVSSLWGGGGGRPETRHSCLSQGATFDVIVTDRYRRIHAQRHLKNVHEEPKNGRPGYISHAAVEMLKKKALSCDLRGASWDHDVFVSELWAAAKEELGEAGGNGESVPQPCRKTVDHYRKLIVPVSVKSPGTQTRRREEVVSACVLLFLTRMQVAADLRNQLDFAVLLTGMHEQLGPHFTPSLDFNTDTTTVWVEEETGKIYMTDGAKEVLAGQHKSPTVSRDQKQRRCASLISTTAADGVDLCHIVVIKDRTVKQRVLEKVSPVFKQRFQKQDFNFPCQVDLAGNIWLLVIPSKSDGPDAPSEDAMQIALQEVITPAIIKKHAEVMETVRSNEELRARQQRARAGGASEPSAGASSDASATEPTNPTGAPLPSLHVVLSCDGEIKFLEAALNFVTQTLEKANITAHLFKFAASASKTQQPLDVSTSFMCIKTLLKKILKNEAMVAHHLVDRVGILLETTDPGSKKTLTAFLLRIPSILQQAFTRHAIQEGWALAGVYPLNVIAILRRCTTYGALSHAQADALLAAVPKLVPFAIENGELSDQEMQDAVGNVIQFDEWLEAQLRRPVKRGMPLNKLVCNRRRCLLLDHPHQRELQQQEKERSQQRKDKRLERAQRKLVPVVAPVPPTPPKAIPAPPATPAPPPPPLAAPDRPAKKPRPTPPSPAAPHTPVVSTRCGRTINRPSKLN